MKIHWIKPDSAELASYQLSYTELVPAGDLPLILENNGKSTSQFMASLSHDRLIYRYANGKWSIPQILAHIIDAERIFSYRILCIARADKTPLPGFEENEYAKQSNADERDFGDIMEEFLHVRGATVSLLKSLNNNQIQTVGISNGKKISALALSYILAGHEIHHVHVIKEKYLS